MDPDKTFDAASEAERVKYVRAYSEAKYARGAGRQALKNADLIGEIVNRFGVKRAIDFGCGNGTAAIMLAGFGVEHTTLYDFMGGQYLLPEVREMILEGRAAFYQHSLWDPGLPGRSADLGLCTDVMEHIPEPFVDTVLEAIAARVPRCFFRIALYPDSPTAIARRGGALHVTVRPPDWWEAKILHHFDVLTSHVETKKTNSDKKVLVCLAE